ncbi:MAG TPA: hypothetical protein VGN60_03025 [Devosia sp.]|jgi:hypothetical protein|nr:hypothetical protein [Devosia sp.]
MKQIIAFAVAMLGLAAIPALAQEAQCHQNDQFLVIAQERVDTVGADFIIRSPAQGKIKCVYEINEGDEVLDNPDDPLHFQQLVGQYLVLTRSTGPQGNIVIYDLAADLLYPPMIDVGALDDITVSDETITYWQQLVRGTAVNCPEFAEYTGYGLGAMIYEERRLRSAHGDGLGNRPDRLRVAAIVHRALAMISTAPHSCPI